MSIYHTYLYLVYLRFSLDGLDGPDGLYVADR